MKRIMSMEEMLPIINQVLSLGGEFQLITAGTSMLPMLRDRMDTAILAKPTFPIKKYDVILYRRKDNAYVLHRIVNFNNDGYVLCGDNQFVYEYGIKDNDIIAILKAFVKNGKRTECNSFKNKVYKNFWCKSRPIRRFYLRVISFLRRKLHKTT